MRNLRAWLRVPAISFAALLDILEAQLNMIQPASISSSRRGPSSPTPEVIRFM